MKSSLKYIFFGNKSVENECITCERDLRDAQTQAIDDLFDGLRRKNEIIIAVSHMPIVEGYSRHFLIKELNIQDKIRDIEKGRGIDFNLEDRTYTRFPPVQEVPEVKNTQQGETLF